MGKITTPLVNLMIAIVVKAALTYALVGIPGMGVRGAAIATSAYFGVAAILNLLAIMRVQKRALDLGPILKLALAGGGMAIVVSLSYAAASPLLGGKFATLASIGAGVLAYGVLAVVFRAIDPADLESIPVLGKLLRRH
jgi:stage V sporulation protein B